MTSTHPETVQHDATEAEHGHSDHRLFGLATFLVADGMTLRRVLRGVPHLPGREPPSGRAHLRTRTGAAHHQHRAVAWSAASPSTAPAPPCVGATTPYASAWLLVTALLGFSFLAGQMKEYFSLPFGLTDNLFASTFYAITGFHGLHVTLGGLMILIVWWQSREGGRISVDNQFPLEAAELYWHFVDGIWVILYGLLYLL